MSNKVNKRNKNKIVQSLTIRGEGADVGLYQFRTSDGFTIIFPARTVEEISKVDKMRLRHIKQTIESFTKDDILGLFDNKEEGIQLLASGSTSLLDLHMKVNSTKEMVLYNTMANTIIPVLLDGVEDAVNKDAKLYVTTAVGTGANKELRTRFIEQSTNKVFEFRTDPEHESLAEPLEVYIATAAELMQYLVDDLYFRVCINRDPILEDGRMDTIENYMVPLSSTLDILDRLVESGEIQLQQEV